MSEKKKVKKCEGCIHMDKYGICNYLLDTKVRRQAPYSKQLNCCAKYDTGNREKPRPVHLQEVERTSKHELCSEAAKRQVRRISTVPLDREAITGKLRELHMSQRAFADRLGTSESSVSSILERRRAKMSTLQKWADVLDCNVIDITG